MVNYNLNTFCKHDSSHIEGCGHKVFIKLFFTAFLLLVSLNIKAQYSIEELQAVYIERFTRFIEWPKNAGFNKENEDFKIALMGEITFEKELYVAYKNQQIKGHDIRFEQLLNIDDATNFNLIIIGNVSKQKLKEIINKTLNLPILLIGKQRSFAEEGGCINLYFDHDKLKFEINTESLKNKGLKADFLLLQYARIIKNEN